MNINTLLLTCHLGSEHTSVGRTWVADVDQDGSVYTVARRGA